jgi:hypothetical protein
MKFEIKNRYSGNVLFSLACGSFKLCVEAAVKTRANLTDADLTRANLTDADLTRANLTDASLDGATMPGFADNLPTSIEDAARKTREWLAEERWIKSCWIRTPKGAYSGQCVACLHGAAVYVGGPEFGPALSSRLIHLGYTVSWNDATDRKLSEVLDALDVVAAE